MVTAKSEIPLSRFSVNDLIVENASVERFLLSGDLKDVTTIGYVIAHNVKSNLIEIAGIAQG